MINSQEARRFIGVTDFTEFLQEYSIDIEVPNAIRKRHASQTFSINYGLKFNTYN